MTTSDEHRRLRELLGAHALGDLPADLLPGLRAHLDGCGSCRAELAELAPLRERLREVDVDALSVTALPPPDLGDRIRAQVAQERTARRAPVGRRLLAAAAAVAVLAGAVGVGAALGSRTATPSTPVAVPTAGPLPVEEVPLQTAAGVSARSASVVAHTWGVEARFAGAGFAAGRTYRAAFRADDGRLLPAGEFLGTGDRELRCTMQSALLRADAAGFVVTDDAGVTVLSAAL